MMGVLHFMAVSTGPVLNYRTLSPPLGPVNFAARHRALPKVRHRDRRAPSGSRCGSGRGARDLSTICVTIASRLVILRRRPSIITDDRLVQRIGQQCRQAPGAAAAGVAGLLLLEAGVQRRLARAHRVIALAVRHAPPPLRLGACIYSPYVLICQPNTCYYSNNESGVKCRGKFSLQPPSGALNASLLPEPCFGCLTVWSALP